LVIEIEESNIKPTQILGKFLTTAFSEHFMNDKLLGRNGLIPLSDCSFLQIAYTGNLSKRSQKPNQLLLLRDRIKSKLPLPPMANYGLVMVPDWKTAGRQVMEVLQRLLEHSSKSSDK